MDLIKEKGEYGFHYRAMKQAGSGSAGAFRKNSMFYVFWWAEKADAKFIKYLPKFYNFFAYFKYTNMLLLPYDGIVMEQHVFHSFNKNL